MISEREIRAIVQSNNKRIGKSAIKRLEKILREEIRALLKDAEKRADFAGRKTIKERDISVD